MNFHDRHYSANRMKLVVLGKESLDQLEQWVGEMFSPVVNKDLTQNRWDGPQPYTEEQLQTTIFAKPVMESRSLEMNFPFLDEEHMYDTQPGRYISHLIGHEGPGSILAYLKGKGLANGLAAGAAPVCPGTAFFHISIRLTEKGLKRYKEIVEVIFQYIALIKESPPQEWIMDEIKNIAAVDFRFREKTPASAFASRMSSVMQKPLPREWLLSGLEIIRRFDSEAISKALNYVRPDNFRLTIISQDFPGSWDQKERWYGTEYRVDRFESSFKSALAEASTITKQHRIPELHLPHRNEFIPTKLSVDKKETANPSLAPKLIRNDESIRTWWKKDDTFFVPKGAITINMRNPLGNATPSCMVKARMFCELVKDALVEYSYDAEISGLDYHLAAYPVGLGVDVSGYNDKMSVLLEKILVSMRDLEVKTDRFDIMKERLLRGFRNWKFQQPFRQIGDFTGWLITAQGWIVEQFVPELQSLTAEELSAFFPQLLRQMHVEVFCHGNIYKEDALRMSDLVHTTFRYQALPPALWQVKRNVLLSPGSDFTYQRPLGDPDNVNNCIEYYLNVGSLNDRALKARVLLLGQLGDELGFDQLRTKEQLGYVVWTGAKINSTTLGYRVIIQSERPPDYLEDRINAFLALFGKTLETMSEKDFQAHKSSLINKRLEKYKNLNEETSRIWAFIGSEYFDFFQREKEAETIATLSKDDMVSFFKAYIDPTSSTRAKLSIHLQAQATPKSLADTISPETQKQNVLAILEQASSAMGIAPDPEAWKSAFEGLKVAEGGKGAILKAYQQCLSASVLVSDEQTPGVLEEVSKLLDNVLPNLGIEVKAEIDGEEPQSKLPPVPAVKKTSLIDDVRGFKSGLQLSAGPNPVTNLTEFEELDSKL